MDISQIDSLKGNEKDQHLSFVFTVHNLGVLFVLRAQQWYFHFLGSRVYLLLLPLLAIWFCSQVFHASFVVYFPSQIALVVWNEENALYSSFICHYVLENNVQIQ